MGMQRILIQVQNTTCEQIQTLSFPGDGKALIEASLVTIFYEFKTERSM